MEKRKSVRLKDYDYSQNGAYFVTICSAKKEHIFGQVVGAGHLAGPYVQLSCIGEIVDKYILSIFNSYPDMFIDAHVVMPNHVHLLIRIDKPQGPARCPASTVTLSKAMSALKSLSSREAGIKLWQRSFYDHIIRRCVKKMCRWHIFSNRPQELCSEEGN